MDLRKENYTYDKDQSKTNEAPEFRVKSHAVQRQTEKHAPMSKISVIEICVLCIMSGWLPFNLPIIHWNPGILLYMTLEWKDSRLLSCSMILFTAPTSSSNAV